MAYATTTDLTNRLSASVVRRIYDDNNDGTADTDPLTLLLAHASSKVDSYLAPLGVLPLTAPYPTEVVRLTLEVAVAFGAQRHPEAVRQDWRLLMEQAEKDLMRLRKGETMLGTYPSTPDPPANHGGNVYTRVEQTADQESTDFKGFFDDMGDF